MQVFDEFTPKNQLVAETSTHEIASQGLRPCVFRPFSVVLNWIITRKNKKIMTSWFCLEQFGALNSRA